MDDLDLEKLKQELNDVSGGSLYDVDEIMREAGSDASDGSGNSLEELMKSLGVEVEEPKTQRMPQEEQKTQPVKAQAAGTAAPVTEEMMPELTLHDDLSALFLAAEQTQALVEEQDAMAAEASGKTEEEPDPFKEQDNVFAQLFAQLGAIEQEEKPTDPRITEPIHELDEEPDLMARLFQQPEEETESEPLEPEERTIHTDMEPLTNRVSEDTAETKPFESILDQATRMLDGETDVIDEAGSEDQFDEIDEEIDEKDDSNQEEEEEKPKKSFFSRLFGVPDEADEEDEADDLDDEEESEEEEDEAEEIQEIEEEELEEEFEEFEEEIDETEDSDEEEQEEQPKKGFFSRLFSPPDEADEEDEADDLDDDEEWEDDDDETDEFDEIDEEEWEEESEEIEEEIDEAEDSDAEEEQPKKGFFSRLFGAADEDEDEIDEDEENEEEDFEEDEESEDEEGEPEEIEEIEEEDAEEIEGSLSEEASDLDETQAFDALSEQETQKIEFLQAEETFFTAASVAVEDGIADQIAQVIDETEEIGGQEPAEETKDVEGQTEDAENSDEEEEAPKKGFLNKLMDAFGLEIVDEEDVSERGYEAEEESEEAAEESDDLTADDEEGSAETEIDMPEEDSVAADFRETLERAEEIEAKEAKLSMPEPRPEDTPVISEEELAAFLSDVDETEEEEHASFEQLLRDSGVEIEEDKPEQQKISLEEFPEEETTVYLDIPIRESSPEEAKQPHQTELFDAEVEMEKEPERPVYHPEKETEQEPEEAFEEEVPEPEPAPDWLNLPMEELCKTAPSMEQLRLEGPVMAREVVRQKEWIMERIRRYQEEERGEQMPHEEPEELETGPEEAEEEPEEMDAIHAADELNALLQQEEDGENDESDSVFHDGPTGKPETEAAGQKESVIEVTVAVSEPEDLDRPQESPEIQEKTAEQPKPQRPQNPKAKKAKASWPQEAVPKDLNKASRDYRIRAGKQARRSSVIAVLTLACIYISCAADFSLLPLPDSMNYAYNPSNVLTVFLVLMGISILLAYDTVWEGIQALLHLQPNLSTLVDLALALNIIHCAIRLISEGEEVPYACIAMLALFAQMRAQVSKSTIRHYTYKVAGNAKQPMGLFYHDGPEPHIVKAPLENTDAFIAQTLRYGSRHRKETVFTVMAVVVAAVLSAIVCTSTGDTGRLIYVLAATITGACQIALICALVMARSHSARQMQHCGTAADDNFGISRLADAQTIVLTDEDLFPAGSIALERLELRSSLNDSTALAYAAALTGGTSLGSMLAEEVRTRYGAPLVARHVVHDVHGGVSGQVGGLDILLGDEKYMAAHGVIARDIPENGLILALDGNVAAVMVIDYQVPAALFNAMQVLTEKKTRIWLHTRNHQITPELVQQKYALKEGIVVVPELETDRALHNPKYTRHDSLCGFMMRDGFAAMSGCITAAREEARIAPVGVIIGTCASLLCMLLMTYLCYVFVPEDAHPIRVLIYMILCFIPIFFLENGVGKE